MGSPAWLWEQNLPRISYQSQQPRAGRCEPSQRRAGSKEQGRKFGEKKRKREEEEKKEKQPHKVTLKSGLRIWLFHLGSMKAAKLAKQK